MKRMLSCTLIVLVASAGAFADPVDLSSSSYSYDIPAGAGHITIISFDYSYGDATPSITPAFRIRSLKDDDTDGWLGSFNIHPGSFNLDTTYGPYSNANDPIDLSGTNHYEFTLNRSNGLWELKLNGDQVAFYPTGSTTSPQPDGYVPVAGQEIQNKYFTDESETSGNNAIGLGWAEISDPFDPDNPLTGNAYAGVGGTGAYRLVFLEAGCGAAGRVSAYDSDSPCSGSDASGDVPCSVFSGGSAALTGGKCRPSVALLPCPSHLFRFLRKTAGYCR